MAPRAAPFWGTTKNGNARSPFTKPPVGGCIPPAAFPGANPATSGAEGSPYNQGFQPAQGRFPAAVDPNVPQGYSTWEGYDDCFRALQQMLETTLQQSSLGPINDYPFVSRPIALPMRAVLQIPVAFDPAANAAGVALSAAAGMFSPVPILTPTSAAPPFEALTVLTFPVVEGNVAVIRHWGVTVSAGDPSAANISAEVSGGPNIGADPPSTFISSADSLDEQPTMIIIPENHRLKINVQNLDPHSPMLLTAAIQGWLIRVVKFNESLKSLIRAPGFGPVCKDNV